MASTVMPATIASPADSTAAAGRQQNIFTGGTTDDPAMLPPVSVSPIEAVPEPGADGAMSFSGLINTKLRYPFDSEVSLTDPFGYRTAPVAQFHDAQDMAAGGGTPIRIIGDGIVREAGWASDGCGFALTVQHQVAGQDVTSRYCHMQADSHSFQVGQSVKSGDQAGLVGETGLAFGAHLHLAMRVENEPIDPLPFIAANSN